MNRKKERVIGSLLIGSLLIGSLLIVFWFIIGSRLAHYFVVNGWHPRDGVDAITTSWSFCYWALY